METKTLADLCESMGLTLTIKGQRMAEHDGWRHIAMTATISRLGGPIWSGEYRQGEGYLTPKPSYKRTIHEVETAERNLKAGKWQRPTVADVMASLVNDGEPYFDALSFEEWATNLGYGTDSRKAEAIYRACMETGRQLVRCFTTSEIASLREAAISY